MRALRYVVLAVAIACLAVAGIQHSGILRWTCERSCSALQSWPYSSLVGLLGLLATCGLAIALLLRHDSAFRALSVAAALAGVALLPIMLSFGALCQPCLVVDGCLLTLALTNLPIKRIPELSSAFFVIALSLPLWMWYDEFHVEREIVFTPRPYESLRKEGEPRLIVYSDPNCLACRALMAQLSDPYGGIPAVIGHRWRLIAGQPDSSLRTAIVLESVAQRHPERLYSVYSMLSKLEGPVADADLLKLFGGSSASLIVEEALRAPRNATLEWIVQDSADAKRARIDEIPAFFVVADDRAHKRRVLVRLARARFFEYLNLFLSHQKERTKEVIQ